MHTYDRCTSQTVWKTGNDRRRLDARSTSRRLHCATCPDEWRVRGLRAATMRTARTLEEGPALQRHAAGAFVCRGSPAPIAGYEIMLEWCLSFDGLSCPPPRAAALYSASRDPLLVLSRPASSSRLRHLFMYLFIYLLAGFEDKGVFWVNFGGQPCGWSARDLHLSFLFLLLFFFFHHYYSNFSA